MTGIVYLKILSERTSHDKSIDTFVVENVSFETINLICQYFLILERYYFCDHIGIGCSQAVRSSTLEKTSLIWGNPFYLYLLHVT